MPNLRDSLLPAVDSIRAFESIFGTRRFSVTVRRRVWSGAQQGEGTAMDNNLPLIPRPRVRDVTMRDLTATEAEFRAANGQVVVGNMYRISQITPHYTTAAGVSGGYFAEQLRLWPNNDTGAVENLVALVGDDGYLRECVQVTFAQDRMLGYSMLVKEIDRPRTSLQSIAITPNPASIVHGLTQQLSCTGTFNGGATSSVTTLSAWSSSAPGVATVDIYGNVTAVSAGSTTITATCIGISTTSTVTVT